MLYSPSQWQIWQNKMEQAVSKPRYEHCLRVAEEAANLARAHGLDAEKLRWAGLLHDVARDLPEEQLLASAKEYGIKIGFEEQANPIILHAPVGAEILRQKWHITDAALLQAVELHTVAMAGMDKLCQVLYLADLIEPGRKKWAEREALRKLCYQCLTLGMAAALKSNLLYLQSCGTFVHPRAVEAYHFFTGQE